MKKNLVIALALVFVLGIAGTAFAAANPFVDVPAKHWAYESVAKLAKAGIVDGYGDGTFRGDRTMTRYEMAVVVAKAMANSDKANAAQKAEIAKLEAEFSDELTKLGVRVSALENKVGNIKFTGEVRARYEWTKKGRNDAVNEELGALGLPPLLPSNNPAEKTRLRLGMNAKLTDDLSFVGRFAAESAVGGSSATTQLDQAYLTGKVFGGATFALGRQPIFLGKGLVYDSENRSTLQDGVSITGGNVVKVTGTAFKTGIIPTVYGITLPSTNFYAGNIDWTVNKNLDLTFVYAKTKEDLIKTWAAGFGYNGIKNIGVTFEYGVNSSDSAKATNLSSTGKSDNAKAWMAKVKYLGADGVKPQSYGLWVGYRKADMGFFNNTTLDYTDQTILPLQGAKGFEYGFEYTVFRNGILSLQYNNLKSNVTNVDYDGKNFIAQLTYSF